jgi:SAM-dependent methyltransferase
MIQSIKKRIAPAYYKMLDLYDYIFHSDEKLLPPRALRFVGNGDFLKIGKVFLNTFIEKAHLQKTDDVLDVGCGIGRMAIPLVNYLNNDASYEGFDIVEKGIKWCEKNITPKHPNFHFQIADLYNKRYYPKGKYKASEYKFPFADNSFDFIFLTSVFTHMLPDEIENYTSEISRVLRKNGRCLITFFILNETSETLLAKGGCAFDFKNNYGIYRVQNEQLPEDAVAYQETHIKELFDKYSLTIKQPILYGSWCNRENPYSFQDIIIVEKR